VRDGKRIRVLLDVAVEGNPPPGRRLKDRGDELFERSRLKAELDFERQIKGFDCGHENGRQAESPSSKSTKQKPGVELDKMYERFESLPRKRPISQSSLDQAKTLLGSFVVYVRKKCPKAKLMRDVDVDLAEGFMAHEAQRGVAPKTYNTHLVFMRSLFGRLKGRSGMTENPFEEIPLRDNREMGRTPFTLEELEAILVAARKSDHEFIRPVIVAGICTAMRRGDCCTLEWEDVDLDAGFIEVTTSKTGSKVTIPLFPLLAEEIRRFLPPKPGCVFPMQAIMYRCNPDGITHRVKQDLKDAGFFDAPVPGIAGHRGSLTATRPVGLRAASIRGFHSFRVTWATLALVAGVPVELVRKVTGHQSVSVLLNHYFKPGREDLRRVLQEKMPKMFSVGRDKLAVVDPVKAALADRLKAMSAENWATIRNELLAEIDGATDSKAAEIVLLK